MATLADLFTSLSTAHWTSSMRLSPARPTSPLGTLKLALAPLLNRSAPAAMGRIWRAGGQFPRSARRKSELTIEGCVVCAVKPTIQQSTHPAAAPVAGITSAASAMSTDVRLQG